MEENAAIHTKKTPQWETLCRCLNTRNAEFEWKSSCRKNNNKLLVYRSDKGNVRPKMVNCLSCPIKKRSALMSCVFCCLGYSISKQREVIALGIRHMFYNGRNRDWNRYWQLSLGKQENTNYTHPTRGTASEWQRFATQNVTGRRVNGCQACNLF